MKEAGNKGGRDRLDPLGVGEFLLVGAWGYFILFYFIFYGQELSMGEREMGEVHSFLQSPLREAGMGRQDIEDNLA